MFMLFTCERCGKRIKVDARSQGKRGRCSNCGHVMVIPQFEAASQAMGPAQPHSRQPPPLPAQAHGQEPIATLDAPFRLSPQETRPEVAHAFPEPRATAFPAAPVLVEPALLDRHATPEGFSEFELVAEEINPDEAALASPEIQRGLRELAEFQKDQRPYELSGDPNKSLLFRWDRTSGPAGWLLVKWRRGVGLILRLLRWIDDWAYLISIPFIMLIIFAIAIANRGLVHTGAVVVVLVNYGRFWTDLLALFVRPFKEGPVHGLAFLVPPYGVYYLWSRWDKFKPTFRRLVTSCIPIVLVVLAYAYLPFVNPEARRARSFPERIRSGGRQLIHDIRQDVTKVREDVRKLERKIPSLDESRDAKREPAR